MYSRTELERIQADRIVFLEAKVANLEKENETLKAALTGQTIEAERSYRDNIGKFDQLSRQVFEVVAYLVKVWKRPVSYHEIIRAFMAKYPNIAKEETITRRCRELVEDKWLATPSRGMFITVPKKDT
jgi:hypothetical protein